MQEKPTDPTTELDPAAAAPQPAAAEGAETGADETAEEASEAPKTGGVWQCLNPTCTDVTFKGPKQSEVNGVHPVCPNCGNEPSPHYIYVKDDEDAAAPAASA